MTMKRALNEECSYEISLKLDEKCSRGISYFSQIVFFQSLHYTCFFGAICRLEVPGLCFSPSAASVMMILKVGEDTAREALIAVFVCSILMNTMLMNIL